MFLKIGGMPILCDFRHHIMMASSTDFICASHTEQLTPLFIIPYLHEEITALQQNHPHLSVAACERIFTARRFYTESIQYHRILLHASSIVAEEKAYLFCAPSGGGKSSHAEQWLNFLGKKASLFEDDRVVIGLKEDNLYVWGTPWSKVRMHEKNICYPVQGIALLHKSLQNHIQKYENEYAICAVMKQCPLPKDAWETTRIRKILEKLLQHTSVWNIECDQTVQAAETAFLAMKK